MISQQKVEAALHGLHGELSAYQEEFQQSQAFLQRALTDFSQLGRDRILAEIGDEWTGALPSAEWATYPDFRVPFGQQWPNHEAAREWAFQHILDIPTFAVDGSQIKPTRDFSLPVGVIQIGWFENKHNRAGEYQKDNHIEIIPPNRLLINGEPSSQAIDLIRMQMEMSRLYDYLTEQDGPERATPGPVIFYDGPLLLSFLENLKETKAKYVAELVRILNKSKEKRVPVVGFIDSSHARDMVEMLRQYFGMTLHSDGLTDGMLLGQRLQVGDRTPVMISRRSGIQQEYPEPWRSDLAFVYLKMGQNSRPSRIEFPLWIYEAGLLDRVMDVIRAEIIIGNGYPYCIETADVTALLTAPDREFFFRILQGYVEKNGWNWSMTSKALSKKRRR